MTTGSTTGQNFYPAPDNYPSTSFPQPVPAPDIDPDDDATRISVSYSWMWREVLMAAVDQLMNPATWQGDHDTIITALNRAAQLKLLLQTPASSELAPYWDDETGDDAIGEYEPANGAPYYFKFYEETETLQENIEDWFLGAYVGIIGGIDAAVVFITTARQFRLAWRSRDYGGIVRILLDNVEIGQVDTYSATDGIVSRDVVIPESSSFSALAAGDPHEIQLRFLQEHNAAASTKDGVYWMEFVRKRLYAEEVTPANVRYNDVTDQFEVSPDGGVTWNPDPSIDPRHNTAFQMPAPGGSDPQCDAAARIRAELESINNAIIVAGDVAYAINALIEAIELIFPLSSIIIEIIKVIADLLFVLQAAIEANFDSSVYDDIECIIYCNIQGDGTVTPGDLDDIMTDICAAYVGTVCDVCNIVFRLLLGEVGMSNAAAVRTETGDCAGCECAWCFEEDLTLSNGGYSVVSGGTWTSGVGWEDTLVTVGGDPNRPRRQIFIAKTFPMTGTITKIEVFFTRTLGDTSAMGGSGIFNSTFTYTWLSWGTSAPPMLWTGNESMADIGFALSCGGHDGSSSDPGGTATIYKIRWHGLDTCPFGTPNCD